jgi:phosphoglycerate dehydrogenase-like enzyme
MDGLLGQSDGLIRLAVFAGVFMVMAALNRKLLRGDKDLRNGVWGERFRPGPELRGRTLLILGMGHVGTELARWGRFLGMRVSGITRNVERARGLDLDAIGAPSDLHIFLRDADFIVVAVPLTTETTGMIGRGEFEKMKPGAFLINTSRGPVVDEEELYNALRDRRIAGAALDVWYRYPPPGECGLPANYAFHQLDNVIMTAAIAGFTDGTMRLRWAVIAENLRRLIAGEPLENVVWTRANSELETQNE